MTRAERIAEFDAKADRPRTGWTGGAGSNGLVELWTREAAGLVGIVVGLPSRNSTQGEPGYWTFSVKEGDTVITQGESSRRGWAMDGADTGFPVVN